MHYKTIVQDDLSLGPFPPSPLPSLLCFLSPPHNSLINAFTAKAVLQASKWTPPPEHLHSHLLNVCRKSSEIYSLQFDSNTTLLATVWICRLRNKDSNRVQPRHPPSPRFFPLRMRTSWLSLFFKSPVPVKIGLLWAAWHQNKGLWFKFPAFGCQGCGSSAGLLIFHVQGRPALLLTWLTFPFLDPNWIWLTDITRNCWRAVGCWLSITGI